MIADNLQNTDTKFNKFQSSLEEIDFFSWPDEIREQFLECITVIPFIHNLISPSRPYVQDLARDEEGKAIIDFTNPPLYTNADFFTPTANLYKEKGVLNPYHPSKNPQSDYARYLGTDVRRSYNGYLNHETGMWIPGDMYWYINYCIIQQNKRNKNGISYKSDDIPKFWEGQWWRFLGWDTARKQGLNFAEIASRRKGKSYSAAGRACRDFYLGENEFHRRDVRDIFIADNTQYLIADGTLNKFESMINFVATHTQLPKLRLKDNLNSMNWVLGYMDLNTKLPAGLQNQVMGITISDDPDKPRGKAASFIYFEEFGSFGRLQQTYDTVQYSVREGNDITGICVMAGTGGTRGANFQGALDMIYNPEGILSFENVWDTTSTGKSIFFFPAYINYGGCYNEDGISDVTKALSIILKRRYSKKYGSANPASLTQAVAEEPITIQDSIMKTDANIFPTTALTERILDLDKNPNSYADVYVGTMVQKGDGTVEFVPTNDNPIRQFPHTAGEKRPGAVEIFQMPIKDKNGKIPYGRFISSNDPVDDDSTDTETVSLQSFFVFDLWTDTIVAEYTGRTEFAADFYEQTRLLNIFYNAKMMYENNKKGVFAYYQRMHCLNLLAETPEYLKNKGLQARYTMGNKAYGIHNVAGINATGLEMLRDWLCSPVTTFIKDPEDESKEKEMQIMRLYTLKNKAFLQECAKYNSIGNFDRISAMIMLMLYREEKLIVKGLDTWEELNRDDVKEDPFFSEYDKRKKAREPITF